MTKEAAFFKKNIYFYHLTCVTSFCCEQHSELIVDLGTKAIYSAVDTNSYYIPNTCRLIMNHLTSVKNKLANTHF